MTKRTFSLMLIFVSLGASGCNRFRSRATTVSQPPSLNKPRRVRPASCPLTLPPSVAFTPPGEHVWTADEDQFWLGTDKLYISLPKSGEQWGWLPRDSLGPGKPKLTAKIFWGSVDFDYHKKEDYSLKVTGRRLDGDTPTFEAERVTNALFEPRAAMLTGVYVPAPGCWEITGDYKGAKLSYVVWVYAEKPGDQ